MKNKKRRNKRNKNKREVKNGGSEIGKKEKIGMLNMAEEKKKRLIVNGQKK